MSKILLDTDILSYYLKGNEKVINAASEYLLQYKFLTISSLTSYEIMSGLEAKGAKQQLKLFKKFLNENEILNLSQDSIAISAQIYGELKKGGNIIDDMDLLIAGIAISNKLTLATNNEKHFIRIKDLKIANWTK